MAKETLKPAKGSTDLGTLFNRTVKFKSPDAFLDYNRTFGAGDDHLFELIQHNVEGTARDIGIMQTLGPATHNAHLRHMEHVDLALSLDTVSLDFTGAGALSWTP